MKVLGVCGSLQSTSSNLDLLHAAAAGAPPSVQVLVFEGLADLPLFNPDLEREGTPSSVAAWRDALTDADAVLIACPEYGHSLPGALKNAVDWVIGSGELHEKVVGVTASVPGPGRGLLGLQALIQTLSAIDAVIVGGQPIVRGPAMQSDLQTLLSAVVVAADKAQG